MADHSGKMGCSKSKPVADDKKDAAAAADRAADNTNAEGRRVIVVFGATGQQGGSVIRAMKDDKTFVLKAATRNTESPKAKQLAAEGIEVIKVNIDDAAECKEALKGAYGVFLVTNYWEHLNKEREIQQGKNVVDAAKENGVKHLVFSGLQSAKEAIGKDGCDHFEGKKAIYYYIVEQGVPYTVVDYSFYYENLLSMLKPRKNENNEFVLDIPMGSAPLEMVSVADSGEVTHQIFLRGDEYKGQWIGLVSQIFTVEEYATILSKIFDTKKFVAGTITPEQYGQLGFPGASDLAVMFEFYQSGKCKHDIELTRKLHPNIVTFEQWVENHRDAFEAIFQ